MFTPTGPKRRPWLPGVIALAALAVLGAGFWGLTSVADDGKPHPEPASRASVGDCLENRGSHAEPALFTIACDSAEADYKLVARPGARDTCPAEYDQYEENVDNYGRRDMTLCLARVGH